MSSADQRADLDRQVARVVQGATNLGLSVSEVVTEVGSGLNGRRRKLHRLLADPTVTTIVVEHRDRLARFGVDHLEAALSATGRRIVVLDPQETTGDLVRDITEVLTSLCARLYGPACGEEPRRPRRGGSDRRGRRVLKKFEPREGFVVQAYRFALDPDAGQEAALRSHCGAARAACNWAVAWVLASWSQRAAEESYGIPEQELTPWRPWSLPALRREFNQVKRVDPRFADWWQENSKEAYNTGLASAAAAFADYTASKRGDRVGRRMGRPRFKTKRTAALSCRFTTGVIRVEPGRRHVTLPRRGTIRTHESTRKLERRLANGTARILSATVRFERSRWFCSFQAEVARATGRPARPEVAAGVDLGVTHLAVIADSSGEMRQVPNPRHLDASLARLRRLSRRVSRRQGPAVHDPVTGTTIRRQPSARWERARREPARAHARVANLRADALHQLTTALAREYGTLVVEDLNVAGMPADRRSARGIADAGFGEIRRPLDYKTRWYGGRLVVADRWFPSSKTCSDCGAVKAKLRLSERTFRCATCGLVLDRDANAARNLAALAAACKTGTGVAGDRDAQASNARGADQKTRAITRSRTAAGGRAGGATLPQQRRTEAGHRRQDTTALTLW